MVGWASENVEERNLGRTEAWWTGRDCAGGQGAQNWGDRGEEGVSRSAGSSGGSGGDGRVGDQASVVTWAMLAVRAGGCRQGCGHEWALGRISAVHQQSRQTGEEGGRGQVAGGSNGDSVSGKKRRVQFGRHL